MRQRCARALAITLLAATVCGCAALSQKEREVVTREPGHRMLGSPAAIGPYAIEDLDFALLSDAAYGRTPAGEKTRAEAPTGCPASDDALGTRGWKRWPDFPGPDLAKLIEPAHLRVEVWYRTSTPAVAVTFGGTVLGNNKDLLANVRWFLPKFIASDDEYTMIVKTFAPRFVDEYRRRLASTDPEWAFLRGAVLYSTGHSLGGGLAQQFAYALPVDAPLAVTKVYAFDPSPVTGYFSVDKALRDHNRTGLEIDRIYERGEILALLRSLTSVVYPPSENNARIRAIRYALFWPSTPVGGHSISHLSCALSKVVAAQ